MMKKLNTFNYDLKIVQNPIYFKFPETFTLNDKEYYLIGKSQLLTRQEIEKCKTKEDFENFIKGLKQVKNE
jgi:hypothetical protein